MTKQYAKSLRGRGSKIRANMIRRAEERMAPKPQAKKKKGGR